MRDDNNFKILTGNVLREQGMFYRELIKKCLIETLFYLLESGVVELVKNDSAYRL